MRASAKRPTKSAPPLRSGANDPKQIAARSPVAATIATDSISRDSLSRLFPSWALALSLNGFFLYLGALQLAGGAPRTARTGSWYALVGLLCLVGVWLERDTLRARLTHLSRLTGTYLVAGALLAGWFLLNVALISHGTLPHTLAALLVLWTLPTALLALSLPRESIAPAAAAIAALGGLFVLIELGAILHSPNAPRFSPIAYLDPISAAQFPALGAVALLASTPRNPRHAVGLAVGIALLCAGAVVPGSRGPIVALILGLVAAGVFVRGRRAQQLILAGVVAGLALGYGGTKVVGSSAYLTSSIPGAISTFHIRREWWSSAAKAIPDELVVGHGVAMFVDNTPEAKRMGVAGTRTYPHNSPLESLYSLGLLGALPYLALLVSGMAALVLLARRRRAGLSLAFAAGLYVFAFVSANLSGEIGADATLWAAGALAVGLYAGSRMSRAPAEPTEASAILEQ